MPPRSAPDPVRHLRGLRPALAWALLILVLCLMPGEAVPSWDWTDLLNIDKPVHAVLFGVLLVLLVRGFRTARAGFLRPSRPMLVAFVGTVAYGALTEWMQQLEALGRHGDLNDLLANTVGAVLGMIYLRWRSHRKRPHGMEPVA
jgi:hypothetical protein